LAHPTTSKSLKIAVYSLRLAVSFKARYHTQDAAVAQLVEQRIRNAWVGGSNPFRGTRNTQ
jgi:hypothetical protein